MVATQIIALILQAGPLAVTGQLAPALRGEDASTAALLGSSVSGIAGSIATALSAILLSGMLTVVVGRAVFSRVTIGEAWQRLRPRLLALIGFTALEAAGAIVLIGIVVAIIVGVGYAANGAAAFLIGAPLVLGLFALLVYLGTMLSFAPPLIVLERLGVMPATSGRPAAWCARNDRPRPCRDRRDGPVRGRGLPRRRLGADGQGHAALQ